MSAKLKQHFKSEPVTQQLWRVAETGEVEELDQLFARGADVNARNQHGMTALMKAAYHGRTRMVRALVERGADPNLTRNDRFTALALAAFFGHTETVRILIEHGAKTEVITRCGASAKMWATARTFQETARCLEFKPRLVPAPAPSPVRAPVVAPAVVKTLKEPPEIWDLVHVEEAPRSFNARSAFVSRLQSMKMSFVVGAVVMILSAACVIGFLLFRSSRAHILQAKPEATQRVKATEVRAPVSVTTTESNVSETPTAVVEPAPQPQSSAPSNTTRSRTLKSPAPQIRSRSTVQAESVPVVQNTEVAAPPVAVPKPEAPRTAAKPNTALSPQLIAPSKNAAPKTKVIQWP